MKLSAIVVLLFASPVVAQALPPPAQLKTKQLMEVCESSGISESSMCLGYLNGFNDMHKVSVFNGGKPFYCMTPRDTMVVAALMYAKVVRSAPELWSEAAYLTVLSAWSAAYPCRR